MGKFKAAMYDRLMAMSGERMLALRREVVRPATGRVLELGVGTGQNLPYYPPGTRVIAIEPDPAMLDRARPRACAAEAKVYLVAGAGETLPFPDDVFDEVVATLVFCTVRSPTLSLAEVRRVLKPGGRLRFMEHVRSEDPRWAKLQDVLTPVWRVIADGCCPNRATVASIKGAGFGVEALEQYPFGPYPVRPQVRGTARRD